MKRVALIYTPWYPNLNMVEGELNNNKGTNKYHQIDEKRTNFAVHVSPSLFAILEKHLPTTQSTPSKIQWTGLKNYNPNVNVKMCSTVFQFYCWFGSNPKYLFISL